MAHTVFCLTAVYFTALVGCAFSSPRRTASDEKISDIVEKSILYKPTSENASTKEIPNETETGNILAQDSRGIDDGNGPNPDTNDTIELTYHTTDEKRVDTYSNTSDTLNDVQMKESNESTNNTVDTHSNTSDVIQIKGSSNTQNESANNETAHTNCTTCLSPIEIKALINQRRIDSVKKQILQKLHLDSPPVVRGPIPRLPIRTLVNDYVLDEGILDRQPEYMEDYYAKNLQIFVFGNDVSRNCMAKRSAGCYYFDVVDKVSPEQVQSAELWIYKLFNRNDQYTQTFVLSELGRGHGHRRKAKKDIKRVDAKLKYGWLKIDIKRTVINWLTKPHRNFGLSILCKTCHHKKHKFIFSTKGESMPFIVINAKQHPPVRPTRTLPLRCTDESTECCLATLEINFHDIGWSWIVAPTSFTANYCKGSCDAQHLAHYNHTQVIQDYRWRSESGHQRKAEVSPCCAPISFASRSILYVDGNGATRHVIIPNISATRCGCM